MLPMYIRRTAPPHVLHVRCAPHAMSDKPRDVGSCIQVQCILAGATSLYGKHTVESRPTRRRVASGCDEAAQPRRYRATDKQCDHACAGSWWRGDSHCEREIVFSWKTQEESQIEVKYIFVLNFPLNLWTWRDTRMPDFFSLSSCGKWIVFSQWRGIGRKRCVKHICFDARPFIDRLLNKGGILTRYLHFRQLYIFVYFIPIVFLFAMHVVQREY